MTEFLYSPRSFDGVTEFDTFFYTFGAKAEFDTCSGPVSAPIEFHHFRDLPVELQRLVIDKFYEEIWEVRVESYIAKGVQYVYRGMPPRALFQVSRTLYRWAHAAFWRAFNGFVDLREADDFCVNPEPIRLFDYLGSRLKVLRILKPSAHESHFGPCAVTGGFTKAEDLEFDAFPRRIHYCTINQYRLTDILKGDSPTLDRLQSSIMTSDWFANLVLDEHLQVRRAKQHILRLGFEWEFLDNDLTHPEYYGNVLSIRIEVAEEIRQSRILSVLVEDEENRKVILWKDFMWP